MAVPDWVIDRMRSGGDGEGYRLAAELLSEIGKDIAGIPVSYTHLAGSLHVSRDDRPGASMASSGAWTL